MGYLVIFFPKMSELSINGSQLLQILGENECQEPIIVNMPSPQIPDVFIMILFFNMVSQGFANIFTKHVVWLVLVALFIINHLRNVHQTARQHLAREKALCCTLVCFCL